MHAVHAPWPAAETLPNAQEEQAVGPVVEPGTTENEPASHGLQLLWLAASWKVPAEHKEHAADEAAE